MTVLVGIVSFVFGGIVGVGIMALAVAAGDEDKAREDE